MRRLLTLVAVLGLLVACAEPDEQEGSDPTDQAWELESGSVAGGPIPIVDGHPITLSFVDDGVGGTAACNGYGGSYTFSGNEISITEVFQTEMACTPEEIMESERKYLEALLGVDSFTVTDSRLSLIGEGVELVFVELPPVPTAELTGTVWVLDGMVQDEAVSSVSGERATLELFADGSMLGSTGCRTLHGRYVVTGAEVLMNEMAAEGECSPDLQDQDNLVVTVLGDGFRVAIDGETLTLSSVGNEGLVYIAQR
jgi:heat shock protein HslJ